MIFKKLIIFDYEKKKSKSIVFDEGINVITSKDNQLGKSTIMKSLYYCLGGEVFFSDRLNLKTKIHFLEINVKNDSYLFIRNGKNIVVKHREKVYKFSNMTELSNFLSELFEFKIMLESRGGEYVVAPPVFNFLPYYVDQDRGWTPELSSFDKLDQFIKNKRKFYSYYHLSILNEEFGQIQAQKKELEIHKDKLNDNIKNSRSLLNYIETTLTTYEREINLDSIKLEYETTLSKYKKYSYDLNNLRKYLLNLNEEVYKIDNIIKGIDNTQSGHEKTLKKLKKSLGIECPQCHTLFEVQSKDIFKINYNIVDLNSSKIDLINLKREITDKKQKVEGEYSTLKDKLDEIEREKLKSKYTFDEVLKFKGMEETKQKLTSEYIENNDELNQVKSEIVLINRKLKGWDYDISEANSLYKEMLEYNLYLFNAEENKLPDKIEIDHKLSSSGSGQVRVNLARVYSFLQLKEKKNREHIRLPLLIDSPKGAEQSEDNSKLVLSLITEKMELPNQIIVATIDFESFYDVDSHNVNLISLNNPRYGVLSNEDYITNQLEIDRYFHVYWQSYK